MIFSWAEDPQGKIVHVDSVPQGLNCRCICPHCHERLKARHGKIREHGFAHQSRDRGANLKICYEVTMYKLAEQILLQEKKIHVPSYFGIFKDRDFEFSEVYIENKFNRSDKQPDIIAITTDGKEYLIELTFNYKILHNKKIDNKKLNCIQIDLSSQTLESLYDFLLYSTEDRRWINNQYYFDSIESEYYKRNRFVKIKDVDSCAKCPIKNNCCGIKLNGNPYPITIENNGHYYRLCKNEEFKSITNQKNIENRLAKSEDELELIETAKISQDKRTCFMCKRNLAWMCRNDGYAHCGSYLSMEVPKNTPPETAQICEGFRVKIKR